MIFEDLAYRTSDLASMAFDKDSLYFFQLEEDERGIDSQFPQV